MHQLFVIIGGKEERTSFCILEVFDHHVGQLHRKIQVFRVPIRLQQLEQRVEQESVVIEIGRKTSRAIFVAC